MVYINEWLPNPKGADKGKEWIEFFNSGSVPVNLTGWKVKNGKGASYNLSGTIGPGEYKSVAPKFTIRNANESILLYDEEGRLKDSSSFKGSAEEGKSLIRVSYEDYISRWGISTPGDKNIIPQALTAGAVPYPGVLRNGGIGRIEFASLLFLTSLSVALLMLYALKKENALSKLFFPGN